MARQNETFSSRRLYQAAQVDWCKRNIKHGGKDYRREFKLNGECILWRGTEVNWKKPLKITSNRQADIGSYTHIIQADGTLLIEGRDRARKLR